MPHQQYVADVTGEQVWDPDRGTWRNAYDTVVLSLPRRGGKSLLALLVAVVVLSQPGRRGWYTAQARRDAATQLRDEWAPVLRRSPLPVDIREANGSEAVSVPARDAIVRLFAPTPMSLHGSAGDWIVFDEAWAHTRERGADLITAARPLMATRPGAQLWIVSAAGTSESTWWLDWLAAGRDAAAADTGTGVCHLEWTADADDVDLDDPAVWADTHPAVIGPDNPAGTIDPGWLAEEHQRDAAYFRRVYLNVTDRTGATTASPLPIDVWHAAGIDTAPDRTGTITLGVDCAPDNTATAIVAAIHDTDTTVVETIAHTAGTGWVPGRVAELCDRYNVAAVAIDAGGPAGALVAPMAATGVPIRSLQLRDLTAACAQFTEAVATHAVRHVPHPSLDAAVIGARRRPLGDGSWLWGRRDSDTDVSPLVAATIARSVHPWLYGPVAAIM